MNLIGVRIEVKHHRLLRETILTMNLGCYLIQILINRLFDIDGVTIDSVDVRFDVLEGYHSLFDLPVGPNGLNTVGGSLLNDLVDWKLGATLSPFVCLEGILDRRNGCDSLKQPFEEQDHLLVLMDVHTSVIIENVETDGDDDVKMWRLEDKEILILILEHKLVDKRILFQTLQLLLKLLHVEVAASVRKNLETAVSELLVITEDVVTKRKVRIRELLWRQ